MEPADVWHVVNQWCLLSECARDMFSLPSSDFRTWLMVVQHGVEKKLHLCRGSLQWRRVTISRGCKYHLSKHDYRFDALQLDCFRINETVMSVISPDVVQNNSLAGNILWQKVPSLFFSFVSRPFATAHDFGRSSRHAGAPGVGWRPDRHSVRVPRWQHEAGAVVQELTARVGLAQGRAMASKRTTSHDLESVFHRETGKCLDLCTLGNRPCSSQREFVDECLDMCSAGNWPWSSEFERNEKKWMLGCTCQTTDHDLETKKWVLGYVLVRQPTMIFPMPLSMKSVTPVMSVMSVIFLRPYVFE